MTIAPESTSTSLKLQLRLSDDWFEACDATLLTPGRGIAVLLPDGRQAALFRDRAGRTYAIGNRDPFTGAAVLSRGLLGSAEGRAFVASPCSSSASTWRRGGAWTTRRSRWRRTRYESAERGPGPGLAGPCVPGPGDLRP